MYSWKRADYNTMQVLAQEEKYLRIPLLSLSLSVHMYHTVSAVEDEDQFTEFAVDGKREVVHSLLQSAQGPKHTQN